MYNALIKKFNMPPFKPLRFLAHPLIQSVTAIYCPPYRDIKGSVHHTLELPDGDKLVIVENTPAKWVPGNRIVVLIHGLTGSHLSKYNLRLTKDCLARGFRVFRVNLRGCGPGAGLAKAPYHSGRSDDARFVLNWISNQHPSSPITQIGFSLGGNITLKMLGESDPLPPQLDSAIAISPPVGLFECSQQLCRKENRLYDQHFVRGLRKHTEQTHRYFPELGPLNLPKQMTVYNFDDIYTAPRSGFLNAIDYYRKCSSGPLLPNIKIPTLILHAKDDPFIKVDKYLPCPQNPNITYIETEKGGHVGWLGYHSHTWSFYWMDALIINWISFIKHRFHIEN